MKFRQKLAHNLKDSLKSLVGNISSPWDRDELNSSHNQTFN